jgi:hypothetical protein
MTSGAVLVALGQGVRVPLAPLEMQSGNAHYFQNLVHSVEARF